jgi:cobalt-zinc-cadmium efflux system outer membrane protein
MGWLEQTVRDEITKWHGLFNAWEGNPSMRQRHSSSTRAVERRATRCLPFLASLVLIVSFVSSGWSQRDTELRFADAAPTSVETMPTPLDEADANRGLTLEQLEQKAVASNPSLRRLAALVGAARANTLQVGLRPNPNIGYEGQQLGSGGLAEQHGILFSQEVIRGGKLRLNRAVANHERMRVEQDLAAQEQRVLTDVRTAFYQVLLAQRQIELTNNLIRISDEGSQSVDALFKAKEAGRADILQAQLESENARILAENAQNRHDSAWRSLAAIVGEPDLPPQPLLGDATGSPKEFTYQDSLSRLLELSPEVSAAMMEVERARAALERARVEPVANVSFQGLFNWQDNGIGGKPDGGVAVSVPVPLFNRNQGGIARAEHQLIAARHALSQLELDLQNRFAPVFEQFANARNQVDRYQKTILPAAQESLDLTRKMYGAGEANYTTLLTAQRTYSQTQINYLETVRALRIGEVEIDGLLLRGSLSNTPIGEPNVQESNGRFSPPAGEPGLLNQ